jgi:hypothetical protein
MRRYFVSTYTDGPSTSWNVIDRQTQEWIRRFATELEAKAFATMMGSSAKKQRQTALRVRGSTFETIELDDDGKIIEPPAPCCRPWGVLHAPNCKSWGIT